MLTTIVATLTLIAVGWAVGSPALRAGGLLCLAVGVVLVLTGTPAGLVLIGAGTLAWLTGHWLYGLRHHTYRSPLARRLYTQLLPRRLDPTRGWGLPTTTIDRQPRTTDEGSASEQTPRLARQPASRSTARPVRDVHAKRRHRRGDA